MVGRVFRKLVPRPVKVALQRSFEALANRTELADRLEHLEQRVNQMEAEVFALKPDIVPVSRGSEQAITALLLEHGISKEINRNISKNDMMYGYIAQHCQNADEAQLEYFSTGLHVMQVLEVLMHRGFGAPQEIGAFLDFASGYGRLTRFLIQVLDPRRIWVSDIKPRAVTFQKQQFGVNGFVSAEEPENLVVEQLFDLIFVVSLFTHLSRSTFAKWLQRLCDCLSPKGTLAFSVHDVSLAEGAKIPEDGFLFSSTNEEVGLRSSDQPLNQNQYGVTFVNEVFVQRTIQELDFENKSYVRYPKGLWNQDLYILSRNRRIAWSGLKLPIFD
jgi:SAM-dependent methyltransferase